MRSKMFGVFAVGFLLVGIVGTVYSWTGPLIIDHTCVDTSLIPANWIDSVQAKLKWHYAHTSHGSQLLTGVMRIEAGNSAYDVAIGTSTLPTTSGALCIFDGQEGDNYISPEEYWEAQAGMNKTRDVLNHNPTINLSMWSWCCQADYYTPAQFSPYIDSMVKLESEFPNVTFIYMTGNAQGTDYSGYNRHINNDLIRQHCITNNKVLFDFADLDAWWYNGSSWEFNSYTYSDSTIPVEHTHFNGNEAGHTTYESCEQKGKAVWWMMARLAGWECIGVEETQDSNLKGQILISPNPFVRTAGVRGSGLGIGKIWVYDISGKVVEETNGTTIGKTLEAGIYFVKVGNSELMKIVKLK